MSLGNYQLAKKLKQKTKEKRLNNILSNDDFFNFIKYDFIYFIEKKFTYDS